MMKLFYDATARLLTLVMLFAGADVALAHHAMDGQLPETFLQGLISGFAHPVIGIDHLAFLIVATLLAFSNGGKYRYHLPATFVMATLAGTGIHLAALDIPYAESFVSGSLLIAGLLLAVLAGAKAGWLTLFCAAAGIFHGYAYGESIVGAEPTPLFAYLIGFATIQYAIMAAGLLAMDRFGRRDSRAQTITARITGGVATAIGCLFLVGSLA